MLTLCICDDSPEDTTQIRALADRFVQEHPELGLRTEFFSSPFDLLEHLDEKGGFDLYLLDILMPHMKGIELARRIRERGEPAELIFLTISREYALDAFEVDASGYLVGKNFSGRWWPPSTGWAEPKCLPSCSGPKLD